MRITPLPLPRHGANIGPPMDEDPAMRRALPVLICLLMMSPVALAEQFYKWKDDKGVWHYSAKPPKDQPADKLQVRSAASRADEEEEEEGEDADKPKKTAAPLAPNCVAARQNLLALNTSQKVSKDTDGDGVPEELTLDQHQEEIGLAQRQIAAFCPPEQPAKAEEEEEESE
jgi:hypothetical protein